MFRIFCIAAAVISAVTFVVYGLDKHAAKNNLWRTPESRLLVFGFMGGAVGGLLGMKIFHHKTRKWYFWAVNFAGLVWQIAAGIYLFLNS